MTQCRLVYDNCVLLGYYTASGDNFLPTFRDKDDLEGGTGRLSRNVGKKLSPLAA